jgi:hypothetical protein
MTELKKAWEFDFGRSALKRSRVMTRMFKAFKYVLGAGLALIAMLVIAGSILWAVMTYQDYQSSNPAAITYPSRDD